MLRALEAFNEFGDRIKVDACTQTKVKRGDLKSRGGSHRVGIEANPQSIVYDRPEGAASHPSGCPEPRGNIVIQGQCRSCWHIVKRIALAS